MTDSSAVIAGELNSRELEVKRREVALAIKELEFRASSRPTKPWSSPLVVALLAAAAAATGNAVVTLVNGQLQFNLEQLRAESARILEVISTDDPDLAAENLDFLLQTKLVVDPERVAGIKAYLDGRVPGQGARISATGGATAIIGGPMVTIDEFGNPTIDPNDPWYAENMVEVDIPALVGVPFGGVAGPPSTGKVRVHHLVAEPLKAVFAEIEALRLTGDIKSFEGTLFPRVVRGSVSQVSTHGLGTAIDINAQWNRAGAPPAAEGQQGSLLRLVPIFEKHGFRWGGNFNFPDGMHFEFVDFD